MDILCSSRFKVRNLKDEVAVEDKDKKLLENLK